MCDVCVCAAGGGGGGLKLQTVRIGVLYIITETSSGVKHMGPNTITNTMMKP